MILFLVFLFNWSVPFSNSTCDPWFLRISREGEKPLTILDRGTPLYTTDRSNWSICRSILLFGLVTLSPMLYLAVSCETERLKPDTESDSTWKAGRRGCMLSQRMRLTALPTTNSATTNRVRHCSSTGHQAVVQSLPWGRGPSGRTDPVVNSFERTDMELYAYAMREKGRWMRAGGGWWRR